MKMKVSEFIIKLQNIRDKYHTVYMWGVFGAPVTEALIASKAKQYPDWYTKEKQAKLRGLIGKGYFGFDCVNTIKAILWGWSGDTKKSYGGAEYGANGVPDISADTMLTKLTNASTDFSTIIPGEAVWMPGHIGVYIGYGRVIECTPKWSDGVQLTACENMMKIQGLNGRVWKKHGKIPYLEYDVPANPKPTPKPAGVTYTVKAGDTLTAIAAKCSTTVDDIVKKNGIKNPNAISVGQILKIK